MRPSDSNTTHLQTNNGRTHIALLMYALHLVPLLLLTVVCLFSGEQKPANHWSQQPANCGCQCLVQCEWLLCVCCLFLRGCSVALAFWEESFVFACVLSLCIQECAVERLEMLMLQTNTHTKHPRKRTNRTNKKRAKTHVCFIVQHTLVHIQTRTCARIPTQLQSNHTLSHLDTNMRASDSNTTHLQTNIAHTHIALLMYALPLCCC